MLCSLCERTQFLKKYANWRICEVAEMILRGECMRPTKHHYELDRCM